MPEVNYLKENLTQNNEELLAKVQKSASLRYYLENCCKNTTVILTKNDKPLSA